ERQLKQMVRLVDDLLDVSRITTGKLAISSGRIDVQSVMRDAIESSGSFIDSCGHQLFVEMPPEPLYVNADPVRLAQVFSNLLNNAAKYTDHGGRISFKAQLVDGKIVVSITDNGIGLAPDAASKIFDMFTQVDQSLERAHAGLGVGLALSKHLVELHGGNLSVSSDGPGFGCTFSVNLEIAQQSSNKIDPATATAHTENVRHRILLVDDNVDFVTTMATLLSTMGHDVLVAHEGKEALKIAGKFAPEFAFLDIGMPGMNGYDLARKLRQLPEITHCVLVAVTGWGQEKDRELSRAAGFNHHLVKPVELAQVLEVIDTEIAQ